MYLILKKFRPYFDAPEVNLVKIGTSRTERGSARLGDLQTGLVSFHVLRIYGYRPYEQQGQALASEKGDTYGRRAENFLQTVVQENARKFGSTFAKVRLRFPVLNDDDDRTTGNLTEWFQIPPNKLDELVELADNTLLYNFRPPPLSASKFDDGNHSYIDLSDVPPQILGIRYVRGKAALGTVARTTNSYLGDTVRARRAMDGVAMREAKRKEIERKNKSKLRGTVDFWEDKLLGQKFRDDELSEKFQLEVDRVYYDKSWKQIFVEYSPIVSSITRKTRRGTRKIPQTISKRERDENSGKLLINDALESLNLHKTKQFKDNYVYYSRLNGAETDVDYDANLV